MEPKGDKALTGAPRWACPWPMEVSRMHASSRSRSACELLSPPNGDRSAAETELPKDSQRRLQWIGFAATGVAASVWLMAAIWVWEILTA